MWVNAGCEFNVNLISNMIGVIEGRGITEGLPIVDSMLALIK